MKITSWAAIQPSLHNPNEKVSCPELPRTGECEILREESLHHLAKFGSIFSTEELAVWPANNILWILQNDLVSFGQLLCPDDETLPPVSSCTLWLSIFFKLKHPVGQLSKSWASKWESERGTKLKGMMRMRKRKWLKVGQRGSVSMKLLRVASSPPHPHFPNPWHAAALI